ncbi:MAG: glycosyltransferase involved in cell wall biosynthesis [Sulfurimonas sp.]|jgi:glycosyltransferase involved in cell wall biosynthesis|uniref:glycosyltransferase family 4 protein n=1 Tax=Sulfurimonas sp. TaxID=2022749 RepID=UPI0039E62EB8
MRILTVTNYYPPYFIGGYEIACKETMDFLKSKGHEVIVLTSDYLHSHDDEEYVLRNMQLVNYNKTSRIQKKIAEYQNYKTLSNTIKVIKPDLVYFWSLRGIGINVIKAVEEQNIAKVFEIGDFWMYGYMQPSIKQKIKSLIPFLGNKNIQISPAICVSEWLKEEMHEVYHSQDTYMFPNATLIPHVTSRNNKHIKFIFSGRLDEEKGLDIAISALNEFANKYPDSPFTFDIYGSGEKSYIERCKALAQPIKSKVHFKGKVASKKQIYTDASILLMPTRMREPFGLVIIEAMAYKCAVIATNAYGPAEIIQHKENGLLFDIESHNDLFLNVEKLYFDRQLLNKIQENAYAHVSKNYSIVNVKSKVENLLQDIAGVA